VIEGEEKSSKPATANHDNVAEAKNEDDSGSSYYGESEESEWEEEEEEQDDVEVQNEGKRPGDNEME